MEGLAHMPGMSGCSNQEFEEFMEDYMNSLIPNRELPKYSEAAKKIIDSGELSINKDQIVMQEFEKKKVVTIQGSGVAKNEVKVGKEQADVSQMDIRDLRMRLMDLFTEQTNWKNQLREIGEGMSLDDIRNKINQIQNKIDKHKSIIVKCEEYAKKCGREIVHLGADEADDEFTFIKVHSRYEDPVFYYSIEHSQKRIAFWEGEIAKHEQKLQMMEIAQQQLAQVMEDIADVNDKIKNAATKLTTEPLVEESSVNVEKTYVPVNDSGTTKLYRIDILPLKLCQDKFDEIIYTSPEKNGKQKVLRSILEDSNHFNPRCFNSHEELAIELNKLQSKYVFSKADVDSAFRNKNSKNK